MEIKIESLDGIRAAAKEFVANIGDATVLPSMALWEQARQHSSKLFVRNLA